MTLPVAGLCLGSCTRRLLVLQGFCGMVKGSGTEPLGPEGNQGASEGKCQCRGGAEVSPALPGSWSGQAWWPDVPRTPQGCCCLIHCLFWVSAGDKWTVCNAGPVTKISILSGLFLSDYIVQSLPDSQSSLSIQWLRGQQPSHANHITS